VGSASLGSTPQTNARTTPVLLNEIDSRVSKSGLYCSQGSGITSIATDLDVSDRISVDTSSLSELAHRPVHGCPRHSYLCTCHRHVIVLLSQVVILTTLARRKSSV
jgi:hypothetical protein